MKNRSAARSAFLAAMLAFAAAAPALAADDRAAEHATWQGTLSIPEGPELLLAVEFFERPDGTLGANAASPDQGQRYLPVRSVVRDEGTWTVDIAQPPVTLTGPVVDGVWQARFRQGPMDLPIALRPVDAMTEIMRPQTPTAPAGTEQELWFRNAADGTWLAGTLTLPAGGSAAPAALIVNGSGPAERDAYHAGHRPMAVLAAALARAGVASLRFDKRGVNRSGGTFDPLAIDTIAGDAAAALAALREAPGVDSDRVGLIGHSEGSLVAAMLAARADPAEPAFVVSLAGPGIPLGELFLLQDRTEALAAGATEDQVEALVALAGRLYEAAAQPGDTEALAARREAVLAGATEAELEAFERYNGGTGTLSRSWLTNPGLASFMALDPADYWPRVEAPVLVVNGAADSQVPLDPNLDAIARAAAGPVTRQRIERLNHMLQPTDDAATAAYAEIDETVSEEVLVAVTGFVEDVAGD